jgi:hypothetical protein
MLIKVYTSCHFYSTAKLKDLARTIRNEGEGREGGKEGRGG